MRSHPKLRRSSVAAIAVCAVAVLGVVEHRLVGQSIRALGNVKLRWLPLAIAFATSSIIAVARKHRRLLTAGGDKLSLKRMAAITYAGNAISVSIPVAGTELSAAFTFEELRNRGVEAGSAVWTITVGGLASAVSFAGIAVVGALVSDNTTAVIAGVVGGLISAVPVAVLLVAIRHEAVRLLLTRAVVAVLHLCKRVVKRPRREPRALVDNALAHAAELSLNKRAWVAVLVAATWNWVADICCLAVCIHAVGADIPWAGLILVYSAGATINSIGLVPGGLGIVEVALSTALTKAGLASSEALASVLVYRIISFWLVTAVGWLLYVVLRRRAATRKRTTELVF